ncbi:myb-related transcription factor, partner of profilin [Melanotaenia boesemani]|uniref:myb-related transcription factor, partner of profilin n=1 Tax=Melanotaenia boesemani TaxID=1250792 RepID=UPI001C05BFBD|nr:myb-related transcription factor, partner of profilin [Melanotaenia boesemani]
MSRERLPLIGSPGSKTRVKPPFPSPALHRPHQANRRKFYQQQQTSSSSHPHHGPSSTLLSDTSMTPWEGMALSESSFTTIPPTLPPRPPPPSPPPPKPTPSTPCHRKQEEGEKISGTSFSSEMPSPSLVVPQNNAGGVRKGLRTRKRVLPQHRVPRPARLPPLSPITNLSFSRSFTFSFFELPLHQSPHCRAERIRNLFLLLKQIHY